MTPSVVIVNAVRTPIGAFQGQFKNTSAIVLGATAMRAAYTKVGLEANMVQEAVMGCVLSAGLGQSPCRQALLGAGLNSSTTALTINKVCGSGLKAVTLAHDIIMNENHSIFIAGGMENMTMTPYLLAKGRDGYRMGHAQIFDHMMLDGLEDAYAIGTPMGLFAENTAEKYGFSRQEQDHYAIQTATKAFHAQQTGAFDNEIVPVTVITKDGSFEIMQDEAPSRVKVDKIPHLRPVFKKDGTVTVATASSISDGAAALLIMTEQRARENNLQPLARIIAHASHSQAPEWFTTAPIGAIRKVLQKTGWTSENVDLYEINEAFAVVTMAAMKEIEIPIHKLNIHGGACALGHPIGASGARILVTLVHALINNNLKRGIAALCIGGGEGIAIGIERI